MKNRVVIILVIILVFIGSIITYNIIKERNTDAYKFKLEYESLNNKKNSSGKTYNTISINNHNPIKYITAKDAIDIIKNKTGIIYFGANWCPWCRNAVPVLFDAAKDYEYKTIYYLNMDTVKNTFEIKDGKLVKTVKEKKYYYDLLDSLDGHLKEGTYTLTDENGKVYDTKEKRIYMPFVVAVKKGKIVNSHIGTVDLNKNQTPYDKLTKKQYNKLYSIYEEMILEVYETEVCDDTCN